MGREKQPGHHPPASATTPKHFPETTPPVAADYTQFILTTVMELQKTVAGLTTSVENLAALAMRQDQKLDRISHTIYAAAAVVALVGAVGAFFLNKVSDILVDAAKQSFKPAAVTDSRPAPVPPPPPAQVAPPVAAPAQPPAAPAPAPGPVR